MVCVHRWDKSGGQRRSLAAIVRPVRDVYRNPTTYIKKDVADEEL